MASLHLQLLPNKSRHWLLFARLTVWTETGKRQTGPGSWTGKWTCSWC